MVKNPYKKFRVRCCVRRDGTSYFWIQRRFMILWVFPLWLDDDDVDRVSNTTRYNSFETAKQAIEKYVSREVVERKAIYL